MPSRSGDGSYVYPDIEDVVTLKLIGLVEPYPDYWGSSERLVLDRIVARLREMGLKRRLQRFLDAGCGQGRLIPTFADFFESGVAVDPDALRLASAAEMIRRRELSDKITCMQMPIEQLAVEDSFDFVLCSHVFQHVHTEVLPSLIKRLCSLVGPGGFLAITTNHSTTGADHFVKEKLENGVHRAQAISQEEFNTLVANQEGVLPIHYFARQTLYELIGAHGLEVVDTFSFHCSGDFGDPERYVHRDVIVNALGDLQERFGRDMFIGARRA